MSFDSISDSSDYYLNFNVAKPNKTVNADDVKAHLSQFVESGHINKWAIPSEIQVVDEIPKTSVGKINKKVIRQQHG